MKHSGILTIAMIVAAASVAFLYARKQPGASGGGAATTKSSGSARLYPDLSSRLGEVSRIEVRQGDKRVEISRGDARTPWVVVSRDGYPAQEELARTLIRSIAEAEVIEKKTASPDFFKRIGVEDPASEGAKSFLVTLSDSNGATLASVILGNKYEAANWDFSKTGTFVRPAGQNQSYLVRATFNPQAEPTSWLNKSLLDMDPGAFRRVILQHPSAGSGESPTVTIERAARSRPEPTLVQLPAGRELSDPSVHTRTLHAIAMLMLEDVRKSEGFDLTGAVIGTWTTFDGLVITTACVRRDDGYWATLDATYQPDAALPREESDPKPPQNESEEIARRAQELHARFHGWVFKVSDFTGRSLVASLESLLKPLTTTEPSEPESPVGVPFMNPDLHDDDEPRPRSDGG